MAPTWDAEKARKVVRRIVTGELLPGSSIPDDEKDLEKAGCVDSMGWVGILTAIEAESGIRNFGNPWPEDRPRSVRALAEVILSSQSAPSPEGDVSRRASASAQPGPVSIVGWGFTLGSVRVEASALDRECGLKPGTLRQRAGIDSVCRADKDEDEVSLTQQAAENAMRLAGVEVEEVDLLVVTSTTFLRLPSLAATLHSRLLLPESCHALDVGGACVGLLNALATAKALLLASGRGVALLVAGEVHSRRLVGSQVSGEFRGLFGDGACAFLLIRDGQTENGRGLRVGDFIFGCAGSHASSLEIALHVEGTLDVQFRGEQLGTAAVSQLGTILRDLEALSGRKIAEVDLFAIHEPNPRLVEIVAQKAGIPAGRIPFASRAFGNLGSASCGVGMCTALDRAESVTTIDRRPVVFVAAVGPGLLWAGTYLD